MLPVDEPAVALSLAAAALYFVVALLLGVWKYVAILRSAEAVAPTYVSIAHRAALMYSFAALLIAHLAAHSAFSARVDFWAAALPLLYFGLAIGSYAIHGLFQRTDNQFRKPHSLGPLPLPALLLHGFMVSLIIAEIGGVLVLCAGLWQTLSR